VCYWFHTFFILWLEVISKSLIIGGWYWDRTSGPCRVKQGAQYGAALSYVPGNQDYEGQILVASAGAVKLSVTVGGASYTASGSQFTSYPSVSSPLLGRTLSFK
jgi:hypothetical protein